jgi:thiamine transport system permease protein
MRKIAAPGSSAADTTGIAAAGEGSRLGPWLFALLPLALIGGGFILPYGAALGAAFGGTGRGEVLTPALVRISLFTVKQAALSTLVALILGLPGAWLIGTGRFRFSALLRALTGIPFAMPPIIVVLGFVLFFGNAGWGNRLYMALTGAPEGPIRLLYRPEAIILAHGFYNFPLVIRLAGDGIARARRAYMGAAATLGASGLGGALTILLPLALPSLVSASLLVFLYSFTGFAVVLVLGGGPAATTLAVEIYRYARLSLDYRSAGTLALVETLIAALVFLLYLGLQRIEAPPQEPRERIMEGREGSPGGYVFAVLYGLGLFLFVLGPLLSVPVESFLFKPSRTAPPQWSLRWWAAFRDFAAPALFRSLALAAAAATAACILGILAGAALRNAPRTSPLRILIRLCAAAPLASSGIVLSLGWLTLYGRDQARSILTVGILHVVAAFPFAFNSIWEGLRDIPAHTAGAAAVFGASPPLRVLTVELPLSLRRVRSAWGFSAAISLGELNAIMLLGPDKFETLPLLIYRAAGSYRYGTACAAGTLLILCCAGFFLFSEASHGS